MTTGLLTIAAIFIILIGLREARVVVVPLLLAVFFALIIARPVFWMQRKGVPRVLAVFLGVLTLIAAFAVVGALLGTSIDDFTARVPEHAEHIRDRVEGWIDALVQGGILPDGVELSDYLDPGAVMSFVANRFQEFGAVLANALLIIFTVVFLLLEATSFPRKLTAAFASDDVLRYLSQFLQNLNTYLVVKTFMSFVLGVAMTAWVALMGVDFPWLWGLLAFLLNFIPNIGSILASIPPILLCLMDFGLGRAVVLTLGYLVANLSLSNLVEPRLMGRSLGLSTLIVFISLFFWSWVLGPVGMLLAAPLTMTIKLALESRKETRWLAILLGSPPSSEAESS